MADVLLNKSSFQKETWDELLVGKFKNVFHCYLRESEFIKKKFPRPHTYFFFEFSIKFKKLNKLLIDDNLA